MIKAVFTGDGSDIRSRKLNEFNHAELKLDGKKHCGAHCASRVDPALTDIRL